MRMYQLDTYSNDIIVISIKSIESYIWFTSKRKISVLVAGDVIMTNQVNSLRPIESYMHQQISQY